MTRALKLWRSSSRRHSSLMRILWVHLTTSISDSTSTTICSVRHLKILVPSSIHRCSVLKKIHRATLLMSLIKTQIP